MPSFEMTSGDVIMTVMVVVLVILPSRLSQLGNLLGRALSGKKPRDQAKS